MDGVVLCVPNAAIKVISVFGQPSEIADSKIAASARPILVIRRGFTKIVETSPYELSDGIRQIILCNKIVFGKIAPRTILRIVA